MSNTADTIITDTAKYRHTGVHAVIIDPADLSYTVADRDGAKQDQRNGIIGDDMIIITIDHTLDADTIRAAVEQA